MSTETTEQPAASLYGRLIGRERSPWIIAGVAVLLLLAPVVAAYLDGALGEAVSEGYWRVTLLPGAVITYILALAPIMTRMEAGVIKAFRPIVQLDDDDFERLVHRASRLSPIGEVLAFGLGAAFGLLGQRSDLEAGLSWLSLYLAVSIPSMLGLLVWTIYTAVVGTRLTAALHRLPLRVDIFDKKPFEPIARQSLVAALAFLGGTLLSLLFGFGLLSFTEWQNWFVYLLLLLVPILIFFLNMRDTHRVLAAEKKRELTAVQQQILTACRTLMDRKGADEDTGTLGAEVSALIAYEERVAAASTWPYNTAQIRTLLFSVIIPGGAAVGRAVMEMVFDGGPFG